VYIDVFLVAVFVSLPCDIALLNSQVYGAEESHLAPLQNCFAHRGMKGTEAVYCKATARPSEALREKESKDIH
jgi:hypothetical protein